MKKFLVFLVSIVVVVCVGLTTYYFMRNNEVITIQAREIYCNVGETIPVNSLGIKIRRPRKSKKTTFNYNAGGEEVKQYISYNKDLNAYVVSNENAGEVELVISTSNKKCNSFTVRVHIGDGSVENPYYIFDESDLGKIGSVYRLDSNFVLMSDIALTNEFRPIGYNHNTSAWDGFSGSFNGNGYKISGVNVCGEFDDVGLFSKINGTASIKNLTIENTTISGSYAKAGALAGEILGSVEKVQVKNVKITNSKNLNCTGGLAGVVSGDVVMSYVDGADITVGDESSNVHATVGGLIGKIDVANVQASYVNNANIKEIDASLTVGGFAGEFVINNSTGAIKQSYANVSSIIEPCAAFIGKISTAEGFDASNSLMLKHLIGNIAVVYGMENTEDITDFNLVGVFDSSYFKNTTFPANKVFFDTQASLYMIRGFANAGEVITTNEFIYYAVDSQITTWDTTYVWSINNNSLPTLKMGTVYPENPSNEYFLRDLTQINLNNNSGFVTAFASDLESKKIKLTSDIDLTSGYTPVAVKNSIIDGNNKTIRINLNTAANDCLGLFTKIDNSTVKNLNIVVTGVSANAKNAGALAGIITSSEADSISSIQNVNVTFEAFQTPVIENFGGLAGNADKAKIENISVNGLNIDANAQIQNAGGIVANNKANIYNSVVNATIYAAQNAGGVAAVNDSTITNITGSVVVNYNKAKDKACVGGVVGYNNSTIDNVTLTVNIDILSAGESCMIGGVAGVNTTGTISNVTLYGENIKISENVNNALIGGVVGVNGGTISKVNNAIKNVGTYHVGKNQKVGGVVSSNTGTINNVLTQSNIYGNSTAGVAFENSGNIDVVAIGVYNKEEKSFTANNIVADKYAAGIVVDFKNGNITNVQATSRIEGKTNSTRSSLVVLLFPNGSNLKSSTINNSIVGYGTKYRETWTDFANYNNKAEFGYSASTTGDSRFNICENNSWHGCMQSVVINSENEGVDSAKYSLNVSYVFGLFTSYDKNDAASSYVKMVKGFNDFTQFQGNFSFLYAESAVAKTKSYATKTIVFDIGSVWESNNGISLMFLNDIL